jgi:opacity protein-like surface antigen
MRAKLYILTLLIFTVPLKVFAQSNFVQEDSITTVGVELVDGGDRLNSQYCQIKKFGDTHQYSPYQIKKYGFDNGRVYVSKDINIADSSVKRAFLEQLVDDKTTLYYYKGKTIKTFFIQKDSTLFIELPKHDGLNKRNNFRKKLIDITSDCQNVSDAVKLVSYNKNSLSKLIYRYNNCELSPFPFPRFGLIAGYGFTKLNTSSANEISYLSEINYKYDGGYILGFFFDYPILSSDFSFHPEFLYSENGFSYNLHDSNKDIDVIINTTSLSVPLFIRYTWPSKKSRPFVELGGIYSYNMRNEGTTYQSLIEGNVITILKASKKPLISDNQAGFSLGGGVQFNLSYRNILSLEIRYINQYRISNDGSYNKNSIQFISGISF